MTTYAYHEDLLGGVGVIHLPAKRERLDSVDDALYQPLEEVPVKDKTRLTLVPYYSWANRSNGQMRVWLYR